MRRHLAVAVLACAVIWSDSYAIPNAETQFGPGVMEEVKAEVCSAWNGKTVTMWGRLYRELATRDGYTDQEITGWRVKVPPALIRPFGRDGADLQPAPPDPEENDR